MDTVAISLLLKERALESTSEGVVIADCAEPGMPIIYVNSAFTTMTGYSPEEVVGRNCRFLQGPETDPAARQAIRDAVSGETPCKVEILNYRKDGTPFWNELSITPVRDDTGRTTHFIGIQSDVTRRRKAEDALRRANQQLKRDLQTAAVVQQAQLPRVLPAVDGFQFGWRFRPCQELAGDTLNILQTDDHHVVAYVLDVSGHGVRAALHSFSLNQDLRLRQEGPDLSSPKAVLDRLNVKYPMDTQTGMFFTILYGVLDIKARTFTFASAGHPGPVLVRHGQKPQFLDTNGYPIGVSARPDYQPQTVHLQAGDRLLLFTDGVPEALSPLDEPFGEDRLLNAVGRCRSGRIDELLDAVIQSVEHWRCHVHLRDDLSLVGIEAL